MQFPAAIFTALVRMARPDQLLAVTLVYGYGFIIALARGAAFNPAALLWGYAALVPIAASIHYANEYADHGTDALTRRTLFSGGSGALQQYRLAPVLALRAAVFSLVAGSLVALIGFWKGQVGGAGLGILTLGAFFGWMYSLKPMALAWRGWGELDNAALGGVLLPLFGFATLAGRVDFFAVLAVLPFGLMVFANLLATTWPDRQADRAVGKRTLATRLAKPELRMLYWAAAAGTFLLLPVLSGHVLPPIVFWACMLSLPVVLWGAWSYTRRRSPLPTVAAMIVMLAAHSLGWLVSIQP